MAELHSTAVVHDDAFQIIRVVFLLAADVARLLGVQFEYVRVARVVFAMEQLVCLVVHIEVRVLTLLLFLFLYVGILALVLIVEYLVFFDVQLHRIRYPVGQLLVLHGLVVHQEALELYQQELGPVLDHGLSRGHLLRVAALTEVLLAQIE